MDSLSCPSKPRLHTPTSTRKQGASSVSSMGESSVQDVIPQPVNVQSATKSSEAQEPSHAGLNSNPPKTTQKQRRCITIVGSNITSNVLVLPGLLIAFLGLVWMLLSQLWTVRNDRLQDCLNFRQVDIYNEECNVTIESGLPSFWLKRSLAHQDQSFESEERIFWIQIAVASVLTLTVGFCSLLWYIPRPDSHRPMVSMVRTPAYVTVAHHGCASFGIGSVHRVNESTGITILHGYYDRNQEALIDLNEGYVSSDSEADCEGEHPCVICDEGGSEASVSSSEHYKDDKWTNRTFMTTLDTAEAKRRQREEILADLAPVEVEDDDLEQPHPWSKRSGFRNRPVHDILESQTDRVYYCRSCKKKIETNVLYIAESSQYHCDQLRCSRCSRTLKFTSTLHIDQGIVTCSKCPPNQQAIARD